MAIATTPVPYRSGEIACTGLLCLDDAIDRARPGVLLLHGGAGLDEHAPARPGAISARILVCHGSADPHVPIDDLAALALELDAAGADWQAVVYGGAQHGFTHEHAGAGAQPGVAYDARADERSFADVRGFLTDVLGG
jgi:hypothetical protein